MNANRLIAPCGRPVNTKPRKSKLCDTLKVVESQQSCSTPADEQQPQAADDQTQA